MTHQNLVRVVFVDSRSGGEVARAELSPDRLPDAFAPHATTVRLDGNEWQVDGADPAAVADVADVRSGGVLVLRVHPVPAAGIDDILYSLPTVCGARPELEDGPQDGGHVLHEDDWRQVELVDARLADVVATELAHVRVVRDGHARAGADGGAVGFDTVHVRAEPADPLPGRPPAGELFALLGGGARRPVAFFGEPGTVPGSFAVALGPVVVYGVVDDDGVAVCGLGPPPGGSGAPEGAPGARPQEQVSGAAHRLGRCLAAFDLLLVDWCRAVTVPAHAVHDYLEAARLEAFPVTDAPASLAMGTCGMPSSTNGGPQAAKPNRA